jgi:hypothetical protein
MRDQRLDPKSDDILTLRVSARRKRIDREMPIVLDNSLSESSSRVAVE